MCEDQGRAEIMMLCWKREASSYLKANNKNWEDVEGGRQSQLEWGGGGIQLSKVNLLWPYSGG